MKAQHCLDRGAVGVVLVNTEDNYISPGMSGTSPVDIATVLGETRLFFFCVDFTFFNVVCVHIVQLSAGLAMKKQAELNQVVIKLTPNNRKVSPYYKPPEGLMVIDMSNPDNPVKVSCLILLFLFMEVVIVSPRRIFSRIFLMLTIFTWKRLPIVHISML